MAMKLVYFNARGRAEVTRWALAQAGVDYEDYRLKEGEWATVKPDSITGTAPFLTIGDKQIATSAACAAYVAKTNGLYGSDDFEAAQIMMVVDVCNDTLTAALKVHFCKDETEKAELGKKFAETDFPKLLTFVNKMLSGGKQWLVGDKVSLADLQVAQFLSEQSHDAIKKLIDNCSATSGLRDRVLALPNIKKWMETRPQTQF